jgi:hypothetical protein
LDGKWCGAWRANWTQRASWIRAKYSPLIDTPKCTYFIQKHKSVRSTWVWDLYRLAICTTIFEQIL